MLDEIVNKLTDEQLHSTDYYETFQEEFLVALEGIQRETCIETYGNTFSDREKVNRLAESVSKSTTVFVKLYFKENNAKTPFDLIETLKSKPYQDYLQDKAPGIYQYCLKEIDRKDRTVLGTLCSILFFPVKISFLFWWLPIKWIWKLMVAIMGLGSPRLVSELNKASYQQEETRTQPSSFNSSSSNQSTSSGRSSRESKESQKPVRQPMYNARAKQQRFVVFAKQQGQGNFVIELRDGPSCKWTKSHSGKLVSGPDVAGGCINYVYEVGQSRRGVSVEIESKRVQTYVA